MLIRFICLVLSLMQVLSFRIVSIGKSQAIGVNKYKEYQTFEGFGTSSAWWSQNIEDEKLAREIARLLYDKETGLGLKTYRFNVGAGEADREDSRIVYPSRQTHSFYYYNEETKQWEYDFTRDENAVRMMDFALEYGAEEIILFCNSPHYSMCANGHASGGFEKKENNLPEENYQAFVDYLLTIADHFVEEGYPVKAISPINEPQWDWGGDWVSQEDCHYDVEQCAKLLELFATTMKARGCKYELRMPESGELSEPYYDYIDRVLESEILRDYCSYYSGHSYWMDFRIPEKTATGNKFKEQYPGIKLEMSEWCELPLTLDNNSIDSGIYMANVIIQDLKYLGAVSWCSWTAVNGDGLMDIDNGNLKLFNRYNAYMHFSRFIKPGAVRIDTMNNKEDTQIESVAFKDGDSIILVLVNNAGDSQKIEFSGMSGKYEIYLSDATHNCEKYQTGSMLLSHEMPPRSIETIIVR